MLKSLPPIPYTLHEMRQLCHRINRLEPEVMLDQHRLLIHDIHPHYLPAGRPVKEHVHSHYEGHFFLAGGGVYDIAPVETVGCTGALLHGPHMPHAWQALESPAMRLLIWFSCDPVIQIPRPASWPVCRDLYWDILLLLQEVDAALPGWHHRAHARLTVILSRFLSVAQWPNSPQPALTPSNNLPAIIDQFFRDNLTRPLTLADITTHVGMSERTLCRQFTELTGETVMERLMNLRMDYAAKLLQDTDESLAAIGECCGMPDPSYFCRRFRKHFHTTPAQYRQWVRTTGI